MLFLETGSPVKSLSSKTLTLSTCFCLRNLFAALDFPPDNALHVSMGQSRIHQARSFCGPNVSLFQQNPICLGPDMKVSCKQICILLHPLYSKSDSIFRLTPVCPVVSRWFGGSVLDVGCLGRVLGVGWLGENTKITKNSFKK